MLTIAFCGVKRSIIEQPMNIQRLVDSISCSRHSIYHNNTCFNFLWYQSKDSSSLSKLCTKLSMKAVKTFILTEWKYIMDAVQPTFPPILVAESLHHVQYISMKKYHNVLKHKSVQLPMIEAEGFAICSISATKSYKLSTNHLFQCEKGGFVSQSQLCDDILDCPLDMSDEEKCVCSVPHMQNHYCRKIEQQDGKLSCGYLYHRSSQKFTRDL